MATTARSPRPTRLKMLDSLLMCLLRLTVRVIMRARRGRINYQGGKESVDYSTSNTVRHEPRRKMNQATTRRLSMEKIKVIPLRAAAMPGVCAKTTCK